MTVFDLLGIDSDADQATIKRAYARRLRTTRPDDDAEAFQQLNEAYRAALHFCRQQDFPDPVPADIPVPPEATAPPAHETSPEQHDEHTRHRAPGTPATTEPAIAAPQVQVDPDALSTEAVAHACEDDPDTLIGWLNGCQAFWSLQTKATVGEQMMQQLYQTAPAMQPACQDALLGFFDLDHARTGYDPLTMQRLRKRMQIGWEIQPQNRRPLAQRLHRREGSWRITDKGALSWINLHLTQLLKPFYIWQVLRAGLVPGRPEALRKFIMQLSEQDPQSLPAAFDRDQMRFWIDAADRDSLHTAKLQLNAFRSLAALLFAAATLLLLAAFGLRQTESLPIFLGLFGACAGVIGLYWIWTGVKLVDAWQTRPERLPARWPWLCTGMIPLLCVLGLIPVWLSLPAQFSAIGVLAALTIAIRRLLKRKKKTGFGKSSLNSPRLFIWIAFIIFGALGSNPDVDSLSVYMLAMATLLVWGIDLWFQRTDLRVRRSRSRMPYPL